MICQNFASIIRKKAYIHPDKVGVVESHTGKEYTFLDMSKRHNKLARAMMKMGIKKYDTIMCIPRNTIEYLDIYHAAAMIGAIMIPVNYRLSPAELIRIAGNAEPKALFFDNKFATTAKVVAESKTTVKDFVVFGQERYDWGINYNQLLTDNSDEELPIEGDSEDIILLMYTAGSSGMPKGVPLKHRNFFFKSQDIIVEMGITKEDTILTVLPLFHIGGNMLYTQATMHAAAKLVLQAQFDAEETFKLIQQHKITATFLLPAHMKMMIQVHDWEKKYKLNSLRFVGSGGEPVPDRVFAAFAEYKFPIFNSYGLTETTGEMIFNRPEYAHLKPANCIGKPCTCRDAKIVDSNGKELSPGQVGEIVVSGPTVVDGYWNNPEATAKAFKDGWLYTGDKGMTDEEGYFYFLGRVDDMIVSGGENIFPAEIEEAILANPKVADVAIVGIPDEKWGQIIKAIIVPKEGEKLTNEEVLESVTKRLASFKKPRIIEFVSELPKGPTGKLDRRLIKKKYSSPES